MEAKVDLTQSTSAALDQNDRAKYQRMLGSLQYLTTTRLDITYVVSKLSQLFNNPNVCHW